MKIRFKIDQRLSLCPLNVSRETALSFTAREKECIKIAFEQRHLRGSDFAWRFT